MPAPRRFEKGSVLAARYEIVRQLGATRMSEVYEAWDRKLDEKVAVKIMRATSMDEEARGRIRQEVRLARKVHHRNVGAIHDFGEDGDLEFISMELVPGQDLRHVLEAKEPLDWDRAYALILEIGEGLVAVHEAGIIHRDLKPANIMVEPSGHPRVMDFGIAKADSGPQAGTTGEGTVKGTPEYMSPEQVRGRGIDFRSDLYAFGVVIFEVFTNRVPFRADTPVLTMLMHIEAPPPLDPAPIGLPSALVPVLRRAMAKDASERYASCTEMLSALREAWAQVDTDKIASVDKEGSGDRKTEAVEIKRRLRPSTTALPEETRLLVPMLTRALANAQTEVRVSAARALALQGPTAAVAVESLRALLRDPIPEVQVEAAAALRAIEPLAPSAPSAPVEPAEHVVGSDLAPCPPVRAGPTRTIHSGPSDEPGIEDASRDAATHERLVPVEQRGESLPEPQPPLPPPPPAVPGPPAPSPAPAAPATTPPVARPEPVPPARAPRPHPSPRQLESKHPEPVSPRAPRAGRPLLPPWLLMLAVATGVFGIGYLITPQRTPITPSLTTSPTTLPGSGGGDVTTETTLPVIPTTVPTTTTPPPKKAGGTNTTLATTTTTVATTTTTTTTTVPTTTTTTTIPPTTTTTLPPPTPTPPPPPLEPPECLKCLPPEYPPIAQRLKREGTVELRIRVDQAGRVTEVQVLKGVEHLTEAAVKAARARLYKPATRGGVAEPAWVEVPIAFRLPK